MRSPSYAELHCLSNFSFLRGASHPEELIERAARLGYAGLALTDECSVAGIVRAHVAARSLPMKLVIGSELSFSGLKLVVLATDHRSYSALCRLLSRARRAAGKGTYRLSRDDFLRCIGPSQCLILWLPEPVPDLRAGGWLKESFAGRVWLAAELLAAGRQRQLYRRWSKAAKSLGLPLVASGNVHMHCRERRALQDTLTAIRLRTPLHALGFELHPNGERCLRPRHELLSCYPQRLLRETMAILERVGFSLHELNYQYPAELVPPGETPAGRLRRLAEEGKRRRWPEGAGEKVERMIEHELELIAELRYESYFLTVHDIVSFARSRNILCQGRGSAANSAVCYCLGITEVDPARMEMLVERFISRERNEPPDIDVDFEHERREEVIQYIYRKYSRERAALAASVITYRPRSAVRDVGKALGLSELQVGKVSKSLQWWDGRRMAPERLADAGLEPDAPKTKLLLELAGQLIGFPRHLSQHVGGFVISERPLDELVPIENAAMPGRTVLQWDKDDLEELGMLKVDVLGLGMLSAIRRSFDLIEQFDGRRLCIERMPADDPKVYGMISRADTVGVFQIESRAQMAMLPRLRPRRYYDLVVEVAIVRPGPIQGDMVHPYLRRRNGEETISYPSPEVERVLQRTLGVPIFQEQVMQLAIVAAGFTPGEADQLRRAMAAWRRRGDLSFFQTRLIEGMRKRGYSDRFAERIIRQIQGFGEYGFPESHAASFALLVYVSAWLKYHEPAAFFCALLNSQPMGFYAPAQLLRAAKQQGVEIRPVDVNASEWDCSLERASEAADSASEPAAEREPALRLGFRTVKGLSAAAVEKLIGARRDAAFAGVQELSERAGLGRRDLTLLADGGALRSLLENRHQAYWAVAGVQPPAPLLPQLRVAEATPLLRAPTEAEDVAADYRRLGLSLGRHPMALLRKQLSDRHIETARAVLELCDGARALSAGLVITRQRPSSASGVTFVTIEDETGYLNLVVWEKLARRRRRVLLGAMLLGVRGVVQREGDVLHVIASEIYDHSPLLAGLDTRSRDFR